jgi:hypothetical protein
MMDAVKVMLDAVMLILDMRNGHACWTSMMDKGRVTATTGVGEAMRDIID